jgi:ATP-dependent DNA helicase RecQ
MLEETNNNYEEKLLNLVLSAENGNHDYSKLAPLEVLRDIFGHNGFKPQQQEIISRILNKEGHSLGIMPTGGGKSLCFQIPALIQKNLTIIVSPLIALMKDQMDNLIKKGTNSAFFVNSSISENIKEKILGLVENKKIKLLYLAPESLKSEGILDVLKKVKIDLLVIDEAHCISTWGHNFRPDYLRLPEMIQELGSPQILALTATATKEVESDIQEQLNVKCKIFKASFDRPNLYIDLIPLEKDVKKELFLLNLVKSLKGPTIIFASYRSSAEELSALLNENGIKSIYYHAGLEREEREKRQNLFISGECDIIVATIAFSMGIDKANIRNIVHYNIPQSIENYYQEIGRAGRDGQISNCIVLFTRKDEFKIKSLISDSWPNEKKIKEIISYLKNQNSDYFFTTTKKIYFDCDIKEIPANLILHWLEEFGAIKIFTNVLHQVKPIFSKDYLKIIEENPKYANDLKKIFSSDFFQNKRRSWLVFEEIMNKTELNYFRILEIFNRLRENDSLIFSEIRRKNLLWVKNEINNFDIIPLVNVFDSILKHDLQKVDLLIESLTTTGCIRKSILEYFDEPDLKNDCEMCSNCVGDKLASNIKLEVDKNYATDEEIEKIKHFPVDVIKDAVPLTLLKCIIQEQDILEKDFVKILVGDLHRFSSTWKFKLNCYELLSNFKNKVIVLDKILEGLVNNELISKEINGSLRITRKGIKYVSENSKPSKSRYHKKLEQIKEKFPNAYENWTFEADEKIKKLYREGKSNLELSEIFQRKPGAIRSRLKKLGLVQ